MKATKQQLTMELAKFNKALSRFNRFNTDSQWERQLWEELIIKRDAIQYRINTFEVAK